MEENVKTENENLSTAEENKFDEVKETVKEKDKEKIEEAFDFSALLPDKMEEILNLSLLQMAEWAHIYMGLIPHPKQKKIVKDTRQAKMAIDAAAALHEVLNPYLNETQQREFKILISDLKMNFISKSAQEQ